MSKQKPMKFFEVYLNNKRLPHLVIATLTDAKAFIRGYETSTHMGEWIKRGGELEYATTIGRYYVFKIKEVQND